MRILPLFLVLFGLVSCGRPSSLVFEVKAEKDAVFKNLNSNIIQSKCIECHKNFKIEENLQKYIHENDPDKSKLFEVVKNGRMPKNGPPLTTLELEMVREYIKKVEPIRIVTFEELRTSILEPKCLSCHKKMGDENLVVEKWVNKKSLFESKLYLSTSNGSMPKKGPRLSKSEMKIIKGYLKSK